MFHFKETLNQATSIVELNFEDLQIEQVRVERGLIRGDEVRKALKKLKNKAPELDNISAELKCVAKSQLT